MPIFFFSNRVSTGRPWWKQKNSGQEKSGNFFVFLKNIREVQGTFSEMLIIVKLKNMVFI